MGNIKKKNDNDPFNLKPCPCCGGKAILFAVDGVRVICTKCHLQTINHIDEWDEYGIAGGSVLDAISDWNRRIPYTPIQQIDGG